MAHGKLWWWSRLCGTRSSDNDDNGSVVKASALYSGYAGSIIGTGAATQGEVSCIFYFPK
jgi:hypothetical protein